jgi:hypothetical protein
MPIRQLFREPMLHYVLIGIALFGAHRLLSPRDVEGRHLVVTQGVLDDLVTQHVAAKGRAPSSIELNRLIDLYVRDEILYREGVRLGLDRDDIVVKRRVRQKIEMMAEEEAGTPTPTDLAAYLSAHRDRFIQPAILTFEQVYLGPADSGPDAVRIVAAIGDALRNGTNPEPLGKPTLLARRMAETPADLVARDFGDVFVAALERAPIGEWMGPVDSSFGSHYVRVSARTAAAAPPLEAVRAAVVREWENDRRQRARHDEYARMRGRYEVSVEVKMATESR